MRLKLIGVIKKISSYGSSDIIWRVGLYFQYIQCSENKSYIMRATVSLVTLQSDPLNCVLKLLIYSASKDCRFFFICLKRCYRLLAVIMEFPYTLCKCLNSEFFWYTSSLQTKPIYENLILPIPPCLPSFPKKQLGIHFPLL